jgi:hypothetical protein
VLAAVSPSKAKRAPNRSGLMKSVNVWKAWYSIAQPFPQTVALGLGFFAALRHNTFAVQAR